MKNKVEVFLNGELMALLYMYVHFDVVKEMN